MKRIGTLVTLACLVLAGLMFVPTLLGLERYVIVSGSMTGSYDRGSIVYAASVPVSELEVGDVITYRPPPAAGSKGLLTHRIVWRGRDRSGAAAFRTKGDANRSPDPWKFTLDGPRQVRVVASVPYVGYVLSALSLRTVRMLLLGLPAALIALGMLARIWHDAGQELRRREAAGSSG